MQLKHILLGLVISLFFGCAGSYLKDATVVNPEKRGYDKILIIAKAKDKTARSRFENQVVNDLALNGIEASSSMSVLKTDSFSKELSDEDLDRLKQQMIADGFDGVIITNLINVEQYTEVQQGGLSSTYMPVSYGRFGRYYRYYPVTYWEPDEISTGYEYTLESCLYDITLPDENLQWVGRFKIKDPSSLKRTIEKYSQDLTAALLEQSIALSLENKKF